MVVLIAILFFAIGAICMGLVIEPLKRALTDLLENL